MRGLSGGGGAGDTRKVSLDPRSSEAGPQGVDSEGPPPKAAGCGQGSVAVEVTVTGRPRPPSPPSCPQVFPRGLCWGELTGEQLPEGSERTEPLSLGAESGGPESPTPTPSWIPFRLWTLVSTACAKRMGVEFRFCCFCWLRVSCFLVCFLVFRLLYGHSRRPGVAIRCHHVAHGCKTQQLKHHPSSDQRPSRAWGGWAPSWGLTQALSWAMQRGEGQLQSSRAQNAGVTLFSHTNCGC